MNTLKGAAAGLLLATLTACGGDDKNNAAASSMVITPALGKVQGASVRVLNLHGRVISQGIIGSSGSVEVQLPATRSGFVIELLGGPAASYFDEGTGTFRPLPAGRVLHAISASPRSSITISAFTEIIYQRARTLAGTEAPTSAQINQAEAEFVAAFPPSAGGSYLDIPAMVDDPTDLPDDSAWAGAHALQLAGLAQHAFLLALHAQPDCVNSLSCSPLLDMTDAIARDFSDGVLDGLQAGSALDSALYPDPFASQLTLRDEISLGLQFFQSRVKAAIANVPLSDRRIGERFTGNYALSCAKSAPAAGTTLPAQLTIAADGSFAATGEFGSMVLLAGSSLGWIHDAADAPSGVGREATLLLSSASNAGTDAPLADGLDIGLGDFPVINLSDFIHLRIAFLGNGQGEVKVNNDVWQCSGFPAFEPQSNIGTERLRAWLPDGNYQCGPSASLTVSNGMLHLPEGALPFTTPYFAYESQGTAGGMVIGERLDQMYVSETTQQTTPPFALLNLQLSQEGFQYGISLRRSLVTGQGYFNVTGNNLSYQYCISTPPPAAP